jgi:hypothetical protein
MFDGGRARPAIEAVSRQAIAPRLLPFPKQHEKYVQHADGHEQNDENPQNRPERLAERQPIEVGFATIAPARGDACLFGKSLASVSGA